MRVQNRKRFSVSSTKMVSFINNRQNGRTTQHRWHAGMLHTAPLTAFFFVYLYMHIHTSHALHYSNTLSFGIDLRNLPAVLTLA